MIRSFSLRHRRAGIALGISLGASALLLGTMRPMPMHAQPGDMPFGEVQLPDISSPSDADLVGANEVRLAQQTTTYTQPDASSPIDMVLPAGSVVEGIGMQTGTDGMMWEQVTDPTGMPLGWMRLTDFQAGVPTATEDAASLQEVVNLLPEAGAASSVTFVPAP